ncbi:hypothetical protein Pla100_33760 [Neorhodopirellula pilleata]|uniref:Uncharacterized protein n=1 Tax=Neorhodopirellula pilleata TaxID=2714738 RepID=A0A5C6A749_9BACT|nr:hypothetical protein Pla100_33760 [Neorhodopirellula pilleata]
MCGGSVNAEAADQVILWFGIDWGLGLGLGLGLSLSLSLSLSLGLSLGLSLLGIERVKRLGGLSRWRLSFTGGAVPVAIHFFDRGNLERSNDSKS